MKKFIYASMFTILVANCGAASSADKAYTFTIKGKVGMKFDVRLEPLECVKKTGKVLKRVLCPVAAVSPVVLTIGKPLTLETTEHKYDLAEGIKAYAKAIKEPENPIEKFGGVCAYNQIGNVLITKCAPVGGTVEFK